MLFRMLDSCLSSDLTRLAVSTFSLGNSMSAGSANVYMDSQKLDAIRSEPCSYYGFASVPKWPQKQSQSIPFLKFS